MPKKAVGSGWTVFESLVSQSSEVSLISVLVVGYLFEPELFLRQSSHTLYRTSKLVSDTEKR